MRLEDKVAIIMGAGQTPGDTIGNGRATAVRFAQEGARQVLVDINIESAEGTRKAVEEAGGEAICMQADIRSSDQCKNVVDACVEAYGRVDILDNNVGVATGDAGPTSLDEEVFSRILDINLKGPWLMIKHTLPVMRRQKSGSIVNISTIASIAATPNTAYKTSKAALNALTHSVAIGNARHGIRCNAILPGFLNTPIAIEGISIARGISKEQLIEERNKMVPMGRMGDAWDVANAALFLASEEAKFVTGVLLAVDGGQSSKIG